MKTFFIISDTHRNLRAIEKLSQIIDESDYVIHLGDNASDMKDYFNKYPDKTYVCSGNCDFFSGDCDEYIIEAEGHRILLCHGHKYSVKSTLDYIVERAKEKECDIALYGHTHIANVQTISNVTLINPGCLKEFSIRKSYCYMVISGQKVVPTIVDIS